MPPNLIRRKTSCLALENAMVELDAKVMSDLLHLCLHLVLHTSTDAEELLDFASIEDEVGGE